jgi:UDP:flavonoid glycosyltransferase YjiC (YdhE family)
MRIALADSPNLMSIEGVDHRALFPRAALVVHHGGAGTTHAVVAAGLPSVVVPHVGDQPFGPIAFFIGSASHPPPVPLAGFSGSRLADAVLATVADQEARATARALAAAVEGEDGIGSSVTLLERASSDG